MNYLAKIRKMSGLTQDDVERFTGIDTSSLSFYENGLRMPPIKNAKKLAKLFGVPWTKFYEEGIYEEGNHNDKTGIGRKAPEAD